MRAMTYWIEFESKSHLWRGVRYSTNIAEFPALIFEHKRDVLSVLSNRKCIVCVEGSSAMKLGDAVFSPKLTNQKMWFLRGLTGLTSNDFSLEFDWNGAHGTDKSGVRITVDKPTQEQYFVTNNFALFLPRTKTRVRIESEDPPQDIHLMIACLAYFWNYFEIDRKYT
jgi:hypothetical protein